MIDYFIETKWAVSRACLNYVPFVVLQQRTLQHNLNCAESEIVKLDETVERFRQILRAHESEVRGWPELGALWMEVVYDKRTDSPRMAWSAVTSQVPKTPAKQE